MGSNEDWGHAPSQQRRDAHDVFIQVTRPLQHTPQIDSFLAEKGLTHADLVRVGARSLKDSVDVIAYHFPDGVKYRNLSSGERWSDAGVEWRSAKIVKGTSATANSRIIIAEGETDGATILSRFPEIDVAILPAGAKHVPPNLAKQVSGYEHVWCALDNDQAGHEGTKLVTAAVPQSLVLRVPDPYKDINEWGLNVPEGEWSITEFVEAPAKQVFSIRELVDADLGTFEDNHYFSDGVLPMRGQCVIHGGFKSLKSFMLIDLLRALATGTTFAGNYSFLRDEPVKSLMFQFEVPPFDFQQRIIGTLDAMGPGERQLFMDNVHVHQIANNEWSRLKADGNLPEVVAHLAAEVGAEVVVFDPVQRMTGKADINSAAEMDLVLGAFEHLQHEGYTVVFAHHNNKGGKDQSSSAYSMSGTQRFGADVDSICSMFRTRGCIPDDNPQQIKQRNFSWTLRNGAARAGSIEVGPRSDNTDLVRVRFGPPIISADDEEDNF